MADHSQLRHDRDRLQVNAERPEYFEHRKVVIDDQCEEQGWEDEELHAKSVVIAIVSGLEFHADQIDRRYSGADEEQLHDRIVGLKKIPYTHIGGGTHRDEVREQIQVSTEENNEKERL